MNWKTIKGGSPFIVDGTTYFHYQITRNTNDGDDVYYSLEARYISDDDTEPRAWEFVAIVTPVRNGLSLFTSNKGVCFTSHMKYLKLKFID